MDAIAAFDLTKEYGGQLALDSLNLQVPQGEAFACVGEKGCGKTTLIRLLSGLTRPTSGECTVLGLSPMHEPQKLHMLAGTLLGHAKLYTDMTLYENLRFFAGLHGLDDNDSLERSSFLLHKLDIWEARDMQVKDLPTGVLRRASLARALMHKPQILLVDESSGGLDLEAAEAIQGLFSCVGEEEGVTLFLCSSNMAFAQVLCDRFAILRQGSLLARGSMEALRQGAGVGFRARLRLSQESPAPVGFSRVGDAWEREIKSREDMPKIIMQAVENGLQLYEAQLVQPTLKEIYSAWLEGGRKKVTEEDGTSDKAPEDGELWEEELPEGAPEEELDWGKSFGDGEENAGTAPEEKLSGEGAPQEEA